MLTRKTVVILRLSRVMSKAKFIVLMALLPLAMGKIVPELEAQFSQELHWSGMEYSLALRFSPNSDHVFVAEKNGRIRMYDSINSKQEDYRRIIDLSRETFLFHDRGMLGLAIHPQFPAMPYLFVVYSANRPTDTSVIQNIWNPPTECPNIRDGFCHGAGRLLRIKVDVVQKTGTIDQILMSDFCGSSPSHHIDDVLFASDGSLYLTAGDGSQFDRMDPGLPLKDECYNKAGPELQGSFKSQYDDSVMGKLLRIFPASLLATRALQWKIDYVVAAKGLRNPYRMTSAPETGDIWIGDVGSDYWEEINVVPNPLVASVTPNFGWPCLEGNEPSPQFAQMQYPFCSNLLGPMMSTLTPPFFAYKHQVPMPTPVAERQYCEASAASPTGLLFYSGHSFPAAWQNVLFMAEGSKRCIFYFENTNGKPDASKLRTFLYTETNPTGPKFGQFVDIVMSPIGDIYITDLYIGNVHKIRYLGANSGPIASLAYTQEGSKVELDASGSSGAVIQYEFDFNGDGIYDVNTKDSRITHDYLDAANIQQVSVRVTDRFGKQNVTSVLIPLGTSLDVKVTVHPEQGQWTVGDYIDFSVVARDSKGLIIPAEFVSWTAGLLHCVYVRCQTVVDMNNCHIHPEIIDASSSPDGYSGRVKAIAHPVPTFMRIVATVRHPTIPGLQKKVEVISRPTIRTITVESTPVLGLSAGTNCAVTPCIVEVMSTMTEHLVVQRLQVDANGNIFKFKRWNIDGMYTMDTVLEVSSVTRNIKVTAEFDPITLTPAANIPGPKSVQVSPEFGSLRIQWIKPILPPGTADYFIIRAYLKDGTVFATTVHQTSSQVLLFVDTVVGTYDVTVSVISGAFEGLASVPQQATTLGAMTDSTILKCLPATKSQLQDASEGYSVPLALTIILVIVGAIMIVGTVSV